MIARTPQPPYYAVIFTSLQSQSTDGYAAMAEQMSNEVEQMEGFLGMEHARDGVGITISYWKDEESIARWKAHRDHRIAQEKGKRDWYESYKVRVARVERDYGMNNAGLK
ncbi:MAG: hypothetical protein RL226_2278 [Bacteroidota bacterium]|jgi:heme-degrading monooxygenase HmoA